MPCPRQVSETFPPFIPSCTICHFSSELRSTRGFLPILPPGRRPRFYLIDESSFSGGHYRRNSSLVTIAMTARHQKRSHHFHFSLHFSYLTSRERGSNVDPLFQVSLGSSGP